MDTAGQGRVAQGGDASPAAAAGGAPQGGRAGQPAAWRGAARPNSWDVAAAQDGGDSRWWLSDDEDESDGEDDPGLKPGTGDAADELYDDAADGLDEAWAAAERQGRASDAILSCPCCLETLCIDCQRHERYETQFRAVFVRNCVVDRTQRLRAQQPQQRQRQQQPRRQQPQQEPVEAAAAGGAAAAGSSGAAAGAGGGGDDVYYPVCCATCKQEVGVLDSDDVYHFFNVVFTAA